MFGVSLDVIWQDRNAKVFKQIEPDCVASSIRIQRIVLQIESSTFISLGDSQISLGPNVKKITKWVRPNFVGFKLSCDGTVDDRNHVACSGIVRDSHGNMVVAFAYNLGEASVLQDESMAILLGVQVAWERGIQILDVESDSLSVVNGCDMRYRCTQTVHNIRSFIDHEGIYNQKHIDRNANA